MIKTLLPLALMFLIGFAGSWALTGLNNKDVEKHLRLEFQKENELIKQDAARVISRSHHREDSLAALVHAYERRDADLTRSVSKIEKKIDRIESRYANVGVDSLVMILETKANGR